MSAMELCSVKMERMNFHVVRLSQYGIYKTL